MDFARILPCFMVATFMSFFSLVHYIVLFSFIVMFCFVSLSPFEFSFIVGFMVSNWVPHLFLVLLITPSVYLSLQCFLFIILCYIFILFILRHASIFRLILHSPMTMVLSSQYHRITLWTKTKRWPRYRFEALGLQCTAIGILSCFLFVSCW